MFWHSKLLFQLAVRFCGLWLIDDDFSFDFLQQLHAKENNYAAAAGVLSQGADYCERAGVQYTRILFLLSQGMMLMIDRNMSEVRQVMNYASPLVESWQGDLQQKECLKVYFLVLQVCHHLNAGQVKSVKDPLKLLQQSIQQISTYQSSDGMSWYFLYCIELLDV